MAVPIISVGPGKVGLDLSLSVLQTVSPVVIADSSDSAFANFIASILFSVYGYTLNIVKVGASLFYTMAL